MQEQSKMTAAQIERQALERRRGALLRVAEKLARIMSRSLCRVIADTSVHGCTNGKDIIVGAQWVHEAAKEQEGIAVLWGILFHELAHIRFTPRQDSELIKRIKSARSTAARPAANVQWAFNALEDQRIESMYGALHQAVQAYFRVTVMTILGKNPSPETFLLVHGRKYLPRSFRQATRAVYERVYSKAQAETAAYLIDSYITLVFPGNELKAWEIVKAFAALLPANNNVGGQSVDDPSGQVTGVSNDQGEPSVADQKKAAEAVEDQIAEDEEAEAEESEDDDGGGSDGDEDGQPGDLTRRVREEQQKALDDASEEISGELDDLDEEVSQISRDDQYVGREHQVLDRISPDGDAVGVATEVHRILNKLKVDLESEKITRQLVGRIDIRRALTATDTDLDIFQTYEDSGREAGGVEVALVIDLSGSMMMLEHQVGMILWALKRACDLSEVKVSVFGFGQDWSVLYPPDKRVDAALVDIYAARAPDTRPTAALREAVNLLSHSSAANKVLICVTDGAWHDDPAEVMVRANKLGIMTALVGLGHNKSLIRHQGWQEAQLISSVTELVEVMTKVTRKAVERLLRSTATLRR